VHRVQGAASNLTPFAYPAQAPNVLIGNATVPRLKVRRGHPLQRFAQGARGDVDVFLGSKVQPESIWRTIEEPALQLKNNIIEHPVPGILGMFRKSIFENIISSHGFQVKIVDRVTVKYKDKGGEVILSVEKLAPPGLWALYSDDMRFDGYEAGGDSEEKRKQVIEGVRGAFAFAGYSLKVV